MTTDGQLAQELTHPRYVKSKSIRGHVGRAPQPLHRQIIAEQGIELDDGRSQLGLDRLRDGDDTRWQVRMHEGRNRQIRRTFQAVGYTVTKLHRVQFGQYSLGSLKRGDYQSMGLDRADA